MIDEHFVEIGAERLSTEGRALPALFGGGDSFQRVLFARVWRNSWGVNFRLP